MIAWSTIDAALELAVQTASGVTDVFWRWEPAAFRQPQHIRLERSPVTVLGVDAREHRAITPATVPPAKAITSRQHGQRSFVLELVCTSNAGSPSDSAPLDASDILSLLVTRMRRPSILAALREAGVALSTFGPVIRQTYEVDGREMRRSILTITWLCADVDADTADDVIEKVNGTLTVQSPDGSNTVLPFSATK